MALDDRDPITPMQSDTIKAALKAVIINALTLITIATGKAFDIQTIQTAVDYGVPVLVNVVSMWYGWRAIKGRISATETIQTKADQPPPPTAG